MADLLWVYGVVPAGPGAPAIAGVEDAPVTMVRNGGLCALVGSVPASRFASGELERALENMGTLAALARAHDRVLEAALEAGDVVPFPLCTIFETPEAIQAMLAAREDDLSTALVRVCGMAEWGVKAFAVAREAVAAGRPSSGTEYLARRRDERERATADAEELASVVAQVHAELAEHARAAVVARVQDRRLSGRDAEMLLNGAYLVPRDGASAFAEVVLALDERFAGLTLELTGPWPPYRFVAEARP
jgi:hypothetical protein